MSSTQIATLDSETSQQQHADETEPNVEDIRTQLGRILAAPELQGSPRRRELLTYLVEETLQGRGDQLKGYTIALAVFGREPSFDASADPLVRLDARRLRRDLDSYYAGTGFGDSIRISIPKGAYVACFERLNRMPASNSPETSSSPSPPRSNEKVPPPTGFPKAETKLSRHSIAFAAIFLLACAGLMSFWLQGQTQGEDAVRGSAVIVLPFEALDSSDEARVLAGGVTQDLISDLIRFPGLRLFSASDSFRYESNLDTEVLDRELGVAFVVRGNIQVENGKVRLVARLESVPTGQVLWDGQYDRLLATGELLDMRKELSSAVSVALGQPYGVVSAAASARLNVDMAPSMASYACVLQAQEYRRAFEDQLFASALTCLETSVQRDPDYADAWAMLGWLNLDAARQDIMPAAEHPAHMEKAQYAAARAIELDPASQRALEALAAIAFYAGDYSEAERLQREALTFNPNDPLLMAHLGWRLAVRGNWDDGLPYLEKAISQSANPPGWYYHMIAVHEYLTGDYKAALMSANHSAKNGSAIGLSLAAISHAKLGNRTEARKALVDMAQVWPLMARDPAAAYRNFQANEHIIGALVKGLRDAGWVEPKSADL